jgi:hypothetical protein
MAFEAIALLIPLDFILLTFIPERNLAREHFVGISAVLFFQATFVAVFARPDQPDWSWLHLSLIHPYHLRLPQPALLMFIVCLGNFALADTALWKSLGSRMFWSLLAACLGLEAGGVSGQGTLYFAVSGLILASSIVESSYSLAYRDELTSLHSRRAFNDAISGMKHPMPLPQSISITSKVSMTPTATTPATRYSGWLRRRLASVTGGGNAYRVGGEEFTILFPGGTRKRFFSISNCYE